MRPAGLEPASPYCFGVFPDDTTKAHMAVHSQWQIVGYEYSHTTMTPPAPSPPARLVLPMVDAPPPPAP